MKYQGLWSFSGIIFACRYKEPELQTSLHIIPGNFHEKLNGTAMTALYTCKLYRKEAER